VNTDQLIAKLDELIAATRSAAIPANMRWLSAESMAAMLEERPVSQQWIPSNGTEGHQFINDWCSRCARDSVCNGQKTFDDCDDSELCQILAASFRGDAKEWIEHDDGRTECTAFVPLGAAQPQRDDRTIDMFGEST
jgi:hypothetical protein